MELVSVTSTNLVDIDFRRQCKEYFEVIPLHYPASAQSNRIFELISLCTSKKQLERSVSFSKNVGIQLGTLLNTTLFRKHFLSFAI